MKTLSVASQHTDKVSTKSLSICQLTPFATKSYQSMDQTSAAAPTTHQPHGGRRLLMGAKRKWFAEIFLYPAAANVGPPPRSKWGGRKRNYLPPRTGCARGPIFTNVMWASAALGSTTLNQWVPSSSPGSPTCVYRKPDPSC